ncbi:MAG: transcriptional regulator PpsR [Limnohabitans sp.]
MKLPDLDSASFALLLSGVSDLTLVLDAAGVIEDVSTGRDTLVSLGCQAWVGRRWLDTVTPESQIKVEDLLRESAEGQAPRWRHINHPSSSGHDVPLQYIVLALGRSGKRVALARDLEGIAELQRRLVETQQSMERDYLRLRHIEARYRVLFDTTSEALLLVDAGSQRVLEANASAQTLLRDGAKRLVGREVRDCFEPGSHAEIQSLLRMALATGRIEMCSANPLGVSVNWTVSATVFRQEGGPQFLLRLAAREGPAERSSGGPSVALAEAMERFPDGWLLTDTQGVVKSVNDEGMALLGVTASSQVVGHPLERWLLRGGVDWGVLGTNLRQQLPVRNFATEVRTLSGLTLPVEISAVSLNRPEPLYAFFLRDIERRHPGASPVTQSLAGTMSDIAQLVWRRPIKDIVGEAVDAIERMCIESALQLTHDNRASAAEMLGLSRQSLYVKLRRFGMIADNESD